MLFNIPMSSQQSLFRNNMRHKSVSSTVLELNTETICIHIVCMAKKKCNIKTCDCYDQNSEINWRYCPSSLIEVTTLTKVNTFIKEKWLRRFTMPLTLYHAFGGCRLIQLLICFWTVKFCLLIVGQIAVMFNEDVYNSVDFRRDFKEGKVLIESNLNDFFRREKSWRGRKK